MKPLYGSVFSLLPCLIVSNILCIEVEIPGTFNGGCVTCKYEIVDNKIVLPNCYFPCDGTRGLKSISKCVYEKSHSKCKDFSITCLDEGTFWNSESTFFTETSRDQCKSRHFDYSNKKEELRIVRSNGEYQFTCTNHSTVLGRKYLSGSTRPACVAASDVCLENDQCITTTAINNTIQDLTTPLPDSIVDFKSFSLQHTLLISIVCLGIVMVVLFLVVQLQRRALSSCEQEPGVTWTRHQHGATLENQHGGSMENQDGAMVNSEIYDTRSGNMELRVKRHQDGGPLENQNGRDLTVENDIYEIGGVKEDNQINPHLPNQSKQ